MRKENQVLLEAAATVARTLACNGLLLSAEVIEDWAALKAIVGEQKVILVVHDEESVRARAESFRLYYGSRPLRCTAPRRSRWQWSWD